MNRTTTMHCFLGLVIILSVSGCSSQRDKLTSELRAYGMHKNKAKCMSGELDDRLSKKEMKSVTRILRTGRKVGDARPSKVLRAIKTLDDPYIVKSAVKSSIGCVLLN